MNNKWNALKYSPTYSIRTTLWKLFKNCGEKEMKSFIFKEIRQTYFKVPREGHNCQMSRDLNKSIKDWKYI